MNIALYLYSLLRSCTFVGIQSSVPEFQGNDKENKRNQNQTSNVKNHIFVLQEIASWIVGRKGERDDKADQPTKERIVNGNRVLSKVIKHIENVNHGA